MRIRSTGNESCATCTDNFLMSQNFRQKKSIIAFLGQFFVVILLQFDELVGEGVHPVPDSFFKAL